MIHQYKLNGFNIVLDVYSGSVHVVDDVAYDIIHFYSYLKDGKMSKEQIIDEVLKLHGKSEGISEEDVIETIDDIEELIKDEKLFTEDIYAPKADYLKNRHTDIKALCLHVAHTCNLDCEYCFASQGKFNGERGLMSLETGKRALDFLIENSGNRVNLEVDFFGGEPLLNFEVVKGIVAYGRKLEKEHNKKFRFTLTTNGVGITDEVIEFANRECHNVVLSLDGRKEVHDYFRKDIKGNGSYDIIVPKFKKLVEARGHKNYYIRGTYTHNNVDFVEDVLHMADLGFTELSMEPVVCDPKDPMALTEADLDKLYEQYERLALEMLKRKKEGRPFTFYHYMINLTHGPCIYKRISGCGSGTEYFAVTPWGDLYPCHQFVSDEEYKMGDIYKGISNEEKSCEFKQCNVYSRSECDQCWARLYCSGGCAANAYHEGGSINSIYDYGCKLFRKRIECAIMMKIAEMELQNEN